MQSLQLHARGRYSYGAHPNDLRVIRRLCMRQGGMEPFVRLSQSHPITCMVPTTHHITCL